MTAKEAREIEAGFRRNTNPSEEDIFLYTEAKVSFIYQGKKHALESLFEDGACVVHFEDKWFRSRDEFFRKAVLDGQKLTAIYDALYDFEAVADNGNH